MVTDLRHTNSAAGYAIGGIGTGGDCVEGSTGRGKPAHVINGSAAATRTPDHTIRS